MGEETDSLGRLVVQFKFNFPLICFISVKNHDDIFLLEGNLNWKARHNVF